MVGADGARPHAERSARIREQERAEVAAHVHDSVLHTLTLIQRHVDDPREVARLARAQERELRGWLYRPRDATRAATVTSAVERVAAEVEDAHGVAIEVVVVGDCPLDDAARARCCDAAREALVNAAKYAGGAADLGLRRGRARAGHGRSSGTAGPGFDPDAVPEDRLGLRQSVLGRMDRHGGRATVRSSPGDGHRGAARDAPPDQERAVTDQPTTARPVRVVLVDDHRMFRSRRARRAGRRRRRSRSSARPRTPSRRSSVITATRPDVVLLDVHLPGGGGRAVLQELVTELPDVKFLALSVSDAPEDVIAVIRGGARGYVTKSITGPELAAAVRRVADGDAVFSPRLAGFVLDAFAATTDVAEVDEDLDRLSQREREVLRLIARGYTYKEVGKALFISVKTVETHVSAVLRKLQLSNRHELTRWATARRLV